VLLEGDTYSLFSSTLHIIFQAFWEALVHFYEETPSANLKIFFETSNTGCSVREAKEVARVIYNATFVQDSKGFRKCKETFKNKASKKLVME
jgi:hypothetical protein